MGFDLARSDAARPRRTFRARRSGHRPLARARHEAGPRRARSGRRAFGRARRIRSRRRAAPRDAGRSRRVRVARGRRRCRGGVRGVPVAPAHARRAAATLRGRRQPSSCSCSKPSIASFSCASTRRFTRRSPRRALTLVPVALLPFWEPLTRRARPAVWLGAACVTTLAALAFVPSSAKRLARYDNYRLLLVESAPIAREAVELAARVAPPEPWDATECADPGSVSRSRFGRGSRACARSSRARRPARHDRRPARRSRRRLRLRAKDHAEPRSARARGRALRARVHGDAAHVVRRRVADDGKVHAAALAAGHGCGLRHLGGPASHLRLSHGGVFPAGRLLHRSDALRGHEAPLARLRVPLGRVRRGRRTARAGRTLPERIVRRPPAVRVGAPVRPARAVRSARRIRLRRSRHRPLRLRSRASGRHARQDRFGVRRETAARRSHRDGRSRRGVRRPRRPLSRHERLRRAGAGAARRLGARCNSPETEPRNRSELVDLLPTVLGALDIPKPPRLRGRDLGALLAGRRADEPGSAYAETEDYALLGKGPLRLVCARRLGACQLFDIDKDPGQKRDLSSERATERDELRAMLRELGASHGRFELGGLRAEGKGWPPAIRRGLSGDGEAAAEIAELLDDADVAVRRKAGEVLFELRRSETAPALRLALAREEDPEARAWAALGLTRLGQGAPLVAELSGWNRRSLRPARGARARRGRRSARAGGPRRMVEGPGGARLRTLAPNPRGARRAQGEGRALSAGSVARRRAPQAVRRAGAFAHRRRGGDRPARSRLCGRAAAERSRGACRRARRARCARRDGGTAPALSRRTGSAAGRSRRRAAIEGARARGRPERKRSRATQEERRARPGRHRGRPLGRQRSGTSRDRSSPFGGRARRGARELRPVTS